jgi:hypothetical protein
MFHYIFSEVKYFFLILNPQYTIKRFVLQEIGIFSWEVSEWLTTRYLKIYSEKKAFFICAPIFARPDGMKKRHEIIPIFG